MNEPFTTTTSLLNVWGADLTGAICERCDWRYLLPPALLPLRCPHCFQAELIELTETADDLNHPPELILPFTLSQEQALQNVQQFARTVWFVPPDLTPQNLVERLRAIYLPVWLVDSDIQATWQAEAGFDYEAVSHRESYDQNQGNWVTQQITETRIRWEPRLGRLQRRYDNVIAPALEEHYTLEQRLGAYNLAAGQPYRPQTAINALIRLPNRAPADAWPDAVPTFQAQATEECRRACQADHIRDFRWQANYTQQNWTLLLLPLYVTYYLDDEQTPQPILIHGQSGQLSGPRRASMKRARRLMGVIETVAVILFLISLVAALLSTVVEPLRLVAGLAIAGAIIVGLAGLIPLVIVWQFNRNQ